MEGEKKKEETLWEKIRKVYPWVIISLAIVLIAGTFYINEQQSQSRSEIIAKLAKNFNLPTTGLENCTEYYDAGFTPSQHSYYLICDTRDATIKKGLLVCHNFADGWYCGWKEQLFLLNETSFSS